MVKMGLPMHDSAAMASKMTKAGMQLPFFPDFQMKNLRHDS